MRSPSNNLYLAAILSIILLAVVGNYTWIRSDNSIVGIDSQNHLFFSLAFFDEFSDIISEKIHSPWQKLKEAFGLLGRPVQYSCMYWPNGLNLGASIFYLISGTSLLSAKLSLLPYLFILLLATYLLGKLIYSEFVGVLATFLLFMYPIIFESSRQFQLDFPLTAMTALNMLFLLRCDGFRDRKYSILLGLGLGWTMQIKGQVLLFITWPLLIVVFSAFRNRPRGTIKDSHRLRQPQNIAFFIILAGLLASIWWVPQSKIAMEGLYEHIFRAGKALESQWSWDKKYSFDSISSHSRALFSSLSPFLFITFLLFLLPFLRQKARYKNILLSWLVFPFLLFSLVFTIKHPRFLMPALPVMALITAWGIWRIKNHRLRALVLGVVVIAASAQYYILSYVNFDFISPKWEDFIYRTSGRTGYHTFRPPFRASLNIDKVVEIIKENSSGGEPVKVGSVNLSWWRPNNFEMLYWLKLKGRFDPVDLCLHVEQFLDGFRSIDFILVYLQPDRGFSRWPGGEEFNTLLAETKPDLVRGLEEEIPEKWGELLKRLESAEADFRLIGEVPGIDGSVYHIYKRLRRR